MAVPAKVCFPPALDGPAGRSLRLDHHANMLHGVPRVITETEPDRTVIGRTPQSAVREPPPTAEKFGTIEPQIHVVIHCRGREVPSIMRHRLERANIPENIVHGTSNTAHNNNVFDCFENKRRAVAAQTARSRSKILSIQYVYYLRAYQRQGTLSWRRSHY